MAKQETHEKRRNALKKGAALAGLAVCGGTMPALMSGCENDTTKSEEESVDFDISAVPAMQQAGGAVKKKFGEHNNGRSVLVIRSGETSFIAMTAVCTHQGYEVNLPAGEGGSLLCPCHESEFDSTTGEVIKGPATASLQMFKTSFDASNNIVKITF